MFERLYDELIESDAGPARPVFVSWLAIYYLLNPFLYLFSVSQHRIFLNFGVQSWQFAALYCLAAPVLGYLLWTVRLRTHIVLYAFAAFEVVRGARHGYWDAVMFGLAILIVALLPHIRSVFSATDRHAHR